MTNNSFFSEKKAQAICIFLIVLIFISKISLHVIPGVPFSLGPFIYQYGMHPYINIGLQLIGFLYLSAYWCNRKSKYPLNLYYRLFIYLICSLLCIQSVVQIIFINAHYSIFAQISGLIMAIVLIYTYAILIPSILAIEDFIYYVKKTSLWIVTLSVLFLPAFFGSMFKGGRFIGFFKHIPHMVSAATLAFIFYTPEIFSPNKAGLKNHTFLKIMLYLVLFISVLLTSTKAAVISILIALFIGFFIFGTKRRTVRLFKFTFLSAVFATIIFCGFPLVKIGTDITTGKISFGFRPAQNGIEARWDEVTRGLDIFETSPMFGRGLMYKYLNGENASLDVDGYNSFKDPHNLFISAGVIGGYPLMIIAIIGYLVMLYYSLKGLGDPNESRRLVALFLLAHLPVFLIYHAHFSLGGIADRIYWLIFGYMAQSSLCQRSSKELPSSLLVNN